MKSTYQAEINHPASRIDLMEWLSTLSDRDYQACSRSHRAAGTFREAGTLGMVNVESIGGHLLVQHYLAVKTAPNHVVMHSKNSRVYVMHLVPATIEVIWTLQIERKDSQSCVLHCTVETRMPVFLNFVATLGLLPLFLRWHVEEEAPLFARDMARKAGDAMLAEGTPSMSNRAAR
jgi:hypothetical protein